MIMHPEIEAKFPDVDTEALRAALKSWGAQLVHVERLMRRKTFDYPDQSLQTKGGWIRVRDEGDRVTLSYKESKNQSIHGTTEICLTVDDFDATVLFLRAIGLQQKAYQETKREKWLLDDVEVTIDTWPWIPTFVELEGPTETAVQAAAKKLGFRWSAAIVGSIETMYLRYYKVSGQEVNLWPEITFSPVPEHIKARKKSST